MGVAACKLRQRRRHSVTEKGTDEGEREGQDFGTWEM